MLDFSKNTQIFLVTYTSQLLILLTNCFIKK